MFKRQHAEPVKTYSVKIKDLLLGDVFEHFDTRYRKKSNERDRIVATDLSNNTNEYFMPQDVVIVTYKCYGASPCTIQKTQEVSPKIRARCYLKNLENGEYFKYYNKFYKKVGIQGQYVLTVLNGQTVRFPLLQLISSYS